MNIFDIIKRETEAVSDKIAVIEGDDQITYGRLLASASWLPERCTRRASAGCTASVCSATTASITSS